MAIGIAYLGHVFYGIPLGLFVQHSESAWRRLSSIPRAAYGVALALGCVAVCSPLLSAECKARDARAAPGEFRVEGKALNPDWLRIDKGGGIRIVNPGAQTAVVSIPAWNREWTLAPNDAVTVEFPTTGIIQVQVADPVRTRSSFVMVEPAESK